MLFVLNNFMKNLFTVKPSDCKSLLDRLHTSKEYMSIGKHFIFSNCITTSSDAIRSTFPNMPFAARKKECLAWSNEILKLRVLTMNMPK